jgi:cytochrome c556
MRKPTVALVLSLSLTGTALAAEIGVKAEMKTVIDPATNTIFAVSGEGDPANGSDAVKVSAARWAEALAASRQLKTAAVHLTGPQKQPGAVWATSAAEFTNLAADAEAAAIKKDGAAFSVAANGLGDTCTACHSKYKKQS